MSDRERKGVPEHRFKVQLFNSIYRSGTGQEQNNVYLRKVTTGLAGYEYDSLAFSGQAFNSFIGTTMQKLYLTMNATFVTG